jgi:amino acid transporter
MVYRLLFGLLVVQYASWYMKYMTLGSIAFLMCHHMCVQGAFCYAELGCAYVSSGGDYTYLRLAFGDLMGFLRVWIEVVLSRPMIVVLSVLTASNYVVYMFYPTCPPPEILIKALSSIFLLLVGFFNLTSKLWTEKLHNFCNYGKLGRITLFFYPSFVDSIKFCLPLFSVTHYYHLYRCIPRISRPSG